MLVGIQAVTIDTCGSGWETTHGCVRDEKFHLKEMSLKNYVSMVRLQVGWKKRKRKMNKKMKVFMIFSLLFVSPGY